MSEAPASRAVHEIQADAMRLAIVRIPDAIQACDWVSLHRLAERLDELAQRGLHHAGLERAKSIATFAMGGHAEREPR